MQYYVIKYVIVNWIQSLGQRQLCQSQMDQSRQISLTETIISLYKGTGKEKLTLTYSMTVLSVTHSSRYPSLRNTKTLLIFVCHWALQFTQLYICFDMLWQVICKTFPLVMFLLFSFTHAEC